MAVAPSKSKPDYASQVKNARVVKGNNQNVNPASDKQSPVWTYPRYQSASTNSKAVAEAQTSSMTKKAPTIKGKVKVVEATWLVISLVWWAELIHIVCVLIALVAAGFEMYLEDTLLGIGAYIFPGQSLFAVSYATALAMGAYIMIAAALTYTFNGVWIVNKSRFINFMLCSVAYFIPIPVPWVGIWMASLIFEKD